MYFRSKTQDEQETQHGEPRADETHSRQDECENCTQSSLLSLLTRHVLLLLLPHHASLPGNFFLEVSTNTVNLTIYRLPALCFFLSAPFPYLSFLCCGNQSLHVCQRVRSGTVISWTNRPNPHWVRALPSCSLSAVCVGRSTRLVAPVRSSRTPATPWTLARPRHRDLRRYAAQSTYSW